MRPSSLDFSSPIKPWIVMFFYLLHLTCCFLTMQQPLCDLEERSSLWRFKDAMSIDWSFCGDQNNSNHNPLGYPKTQSWKFGGATNGDCCKWDGVKCDEESGHVIGLDISGSCLHGSITSNSSLFDLVHLQSLNLASNNFNYSQIPSGFGQLSNLSYLNLSNSFFSGQIPSEISKLSKLASLDLSFNVDSSFSDDGGGGIKLLELKSPSLGSLVQNLTKLEELDLSYVNISSMVPAMFLNLTSLKQLRLRDCELFGDLPQDMFFKLPNLKVINVMENEGITGTLPDRFPSNSPLEKLLLLGTSLSGELPTSIGNLASLCELNIWSCNFSGLIPSSMGNLTRLTTLELGNNSFGGHIPHALANLTHLTYLSLARNNFSDYTIRWLDKLTNLQVMSLDQINLVGEIPYFGSLADLVYARLSSNQLNGKIPNWLMNLTKLVHLDLSFNNLQGPIPISISNLKNLEFLHLFKNNLSGTVELDMFVKLRKLTTLQLSLNNITFVPRTSSANVAIQKFKALSLARCNLDAFPDFLKDQDELNFIDLAYNNIHGLIPTWVWNTSRETLAFVNFSHNFLIGFDHLPDVLPWPRLGILDLRSNRLQGPLPVPPTSTFIYYMSNNLLGGEISPLFCNLTSLYALDLSDNNLSGKLPPCLGNFSGSLTLLNLRNNKFHGEIPPLYPKAGSRLRMIDLSQNQLRGSLPRSLANCTSLEFLILGNNRIYDTFPHWLGTLPELKVVILRFNRFHGAIGGPPDPALANHLKYFPKLRIIDLSSNHFTGELPSEYFRDWYAMKVSGPEEHLTYLQAIASFVLVGYRLNENYDYSMSIMNKGIETEYSKILDYFTAVDLSSNGFEGEIPGIISNLQDLRLLNLSNNALTGPVPPSLSSLKNLESLDLSQNRLSGQIPEQLTQLTFLEVLNLSHNHLTGRIPRGKQFDTFQETSFEGNSGLCGIQLPKKCTANPEISPPPSESKEEKEDYPDDKGSLFELNWMVIFMGYAFGFVVAVAINTLFRRKCHWFV